MGIRGPVRTWTPIRRALIESSLWREPPHVCKLWVTMLIVASEPGRGGDVDLRLDDLAWRAKMPEDLTLAALAVLAAPDPDSRTRTLDGRRIVPIEPGRSWGWRIVNWNAHQIDGRQLAGVEPPDPETPRNSPELPETLPERKRKEMKGKDRGGCAPPSLAEWLAYGKEVLPAWPEADASNAFDFYVSVGWVTGAARKPIKDWHAALRTCSRRWLERNPNVDPYRVIL